MKGQGSKNCGEGSNTKQKFFNLEFYIQLNYRPIIKYKIKILPAKFRLMELTHQQTFAVVTYYECNSGRRKLSREARNKLLKETIM